MEKKYFWLQLVVGFIFLLGGLFIYGLGRMNMMGDRSPGSDTLWICAVGIMFIVTSTCGNFFKKTKQQEIEEKDERNIAIARRAKANAFDTMVFLFAIVIILLNFIGNLDTVTFFVLVGAYFSVQIVFIVSLWYFEKKM